jgi:hypothetical protein
MERIMRALKVACLGVFLAATVLAQTKPSKIVPAELAHAQYVALGYDMGYGFLSDTSITREQFRVLSEDREALQRVREEIQKWKRYVITVKPEDAELLIAVRTGRLTSVNGGYRIGTQNGNKISGPVYGAEVSSPDDMLEVYEAKDGKEGILLWRKLQKDGLLGSPPPLFEQFRRDVDSIPAHQP